MESFIRLLITYAVFIFLYNLIKGNKPNSQGTTKGRPQTSPRPQAGQKMPPIIARPLMERKPKANVRPPRQTPSVQERRVVSPSIPTEEKRIGSTLTEEIRGQEIVQNMPFSGVLESGIGDFLVPSCEDLVRGIVWTEVLSPCLARRGRRR
jgi:hypothetical protein